MAPVIPPGLDCFIVLLRHGETTYIAEQRFQGRAETPLSPTGERQIALAAARLADPSATPPLPIPGRPPQVIVHSPLVRTRRSAELVADAIAAADGAAAPPLRPEPGIAEIGQGEWEGLRATEVAERYPDELRGWRLDPVGTHAPGGEALGDVELRVAAALRGLLEELAAGRPAGSLDRTSVSGYRGAGASDGPWALLVGHDGVFKVVLLTLLGLPLDHFWNFSFSLAAISVVEIRGGRAILRALNLDAHLGVALEPDAVAETAKREASGAL